MQVAGGFAVRPTGRTVHNAVAERAARSRRPIGADSELEEKPGTEPAVQVEDQYESTVVPARGGQAAKRQLSPEILNACENDTLATFLLGRRKRFFRSARAQQDRSFWAS